MKTDVDTALKEIADWYVKNRRELLEPELESILVKHCQDEAELKKFTEFLETAPGQLRFGALLRERKESENPTVIFEDKKWDEPWEITKKAFEEKYPYAPPGTHHDIVKRAFWGEGKPIPIEVTLDYPDIFPGPKPKVEEVKGVDTAIDAGIADLVRVLNNKGYKTYMSCSGLKEDHPGEIEREEGYVVFLTADLSPSQLIEIKGYASSAGLKIRETPGRLTIINDFELDMDKNLAWISLKMLFERGGN